jgi:hypothetical protein
MNTGRFKKTAPSHYWYNAMLKWGEDFSPLPIIPYFGKGT